MLTAAQAEVLAKMEGGLELKSPRVDTKDAQWWLSTWTYERRSEVREVRVSTIGVLVCKGFLWHYHQGDAIYWAVTPSGRQALKEYKEKHRDTR